jgi:hypothetical protein
MIFHFSSTFHEILQSIKAMEAEVLKLDNTKFSQNWEHDTLEVEMIINKKLSILHEGLDVHLNFRLILTWSKIFFNKVYLFYNFVSITS